MIAVLLLAALLTGAHAQVQWDGNRLHATCQQAHGPSSDCAVFIRATVDRYHDFIATHCARQSVPFSKIVESVIADLEASPSTRSLHADQLILKSIGKMAGCRLAHVRSFVDELRFAGTLGNSLVREGGYGAHFRKDT
jgi:hypothetical protein